MVTERGRISKHKFYLPKYLVKGYDGETLWFDITKEDAEDNFKKERPPKEGEYSRYSPASVTQQPNESNTSGLADNSTGSKFPSYNLEEYLPVIEKRRDVNRKMEESSTVQQQQQVVDAVIEDWDSILHKGVRTEDMVSVGIVAAVNMTSVIITSDGAKDEFNVPKEEVKSFNGSEVILKASIDRFDQFKVKVPK